MKATVFVMFLFLASQKLQLVYYRFFRKIFFVHFYLRKRKLTDNQIGFLKDNIRFYNSLTPKEQEYFEHRVASFLDKISFFNHKEIEITDEMKLYVSSTLITLTFGFRKHRLTVLENIIIRPKQYHTRSGRIHKGEFNNRLKTLVLSWEDFMRGFDCLNDNINLGVHEFSHVIHLNSIANRDINSVLFRKNYKRLLFKIKNDQQLKQKIIESNYFREYGFTNQFELLAVLLEHFIETPKELKANFPEIYKRIKFMLNFHFGNY